MKLLFENFRNFLITEAEGQTLYHIGKRPASPKPKRSGWYSEPGDEEGWDRPQHDEPVESGVFLTPNPVGIAQNHGIFGHVYAYNVSNALIAAAGGLNRYDFGSEVLIPEDLWNEGMETGEIQFLGKSMEYDEFVKKADRAMSMGDRLARTKRRYPPEELDESLYYGTSTIFQEEIAKNGIKAPSEWGSYGLAEENAMKIVEKHGGEPAVIQIPLSEFKNEHFLLDESNNYAIIYTEDFHIFMEKQDKKLV